MKTETRYKKTFELTKGEKNMLTQEKELLTALWNNDEEYISDLYQSREKFFKLPIGQICPNILEAIRELINF